MPDLTDFFDQKVSKVTLIFAFIITSVLSAVVIFHCLKVTTLLGGVATSYKVVFQLLSKNFGGLWLGQKKVNMLCYEFYSIERKAFQRRRKKNPLDDWIIPESQSTSLFRRSLYNLNLGLLCTNAMVTIAHTTPISQVTIMPY